MESAKARYEARKEAFIQTCSSAKQKLAGDHSDVKTLNGVRTRVKRTYERILAASDSLIDALLKGNPIPNDDIQNIELEQGEFVQEADVILFDLEEKLKVKDEEVGSHAPGQTSHHKLPKLELPKFGGEAKEWLQFWNAFNTIHQDDSIDALVKFQYLNSCMVPGSNAKEVVSSYPMSEENYNEAVKTLKERFGRDDMLVEYYVRDLITLILNNAQNRTDGSFGTLFVKLSSQLRALASLGVTTDKCAAILYPMVESTLPEDVFVAWERYRIQNNTTGKQTSEGHLEQMMGFLKHEVEGTERIRLARQPFVNVNGNSSLSVTGKPRGNHSISTAASLVTNASGPGTKFVNTCVFCDGKHTSESCCKAISIPMDERRKLVQDKKRCYICLKMGHNAKKCRATVKCISCGRKHWPILCPQIEKKTDDNKGEKDSNKTTEQSSSLSNEVRSETVLLQTLVFLIHGEKKNKLVRAMLDSGSQKSYVLQSTAKEVGLKRVNEEEVIHSLFGGSQRMIKHTRYHVYLSNPDSSYNCNFEVSDVPKITSHLSGIPKGDWITELLQMGIKLDGKLFTSSEVEVLIGSDVYGKLLTGQKIELNAGPVALETKLGWTVSGKIRQRETKQEQPQHTFSCHIQELSIQDLWSLDVIGIHDPVVEKTRSERELAVMEEFTRTVTRNKEGRYIVSLPWIDGHPDLPSYRMIAEKKLLSNMSRLQKQNVADSYHQVIQDWEDAEMIERKNEGTGHYLSHHGVIKFENQSTPVRPVFNASFRTKQQPSLNDCLEVGPNLLEQIPAVLTRFRLGAYGVTSDIRKAFLQIEVAEKDKDYLRFLWYKDSNLDQIQDFRHNRVVFGVSSSPFILAAVLKHHLSNCENNVKETATALSNSFYVDNSLASFSTMKEVEKFKKESTELLQEAKMDLCSWEIGPSDNIRTVPVLGLLWNLKDDVLICDTNRIFKKMFDPVNFTRRKMLSLSQSMFDPIGYTCPFTIIPKMLLQKTCSYGWDAVLPQDITTKFEDWMKEIPDLNKLSIPRRMTCNDQKSSWSLHIFSDSSISAYASCVYLRSGNPGKIQTSLVLARARVAPSKNTTIPRLELIGCLCSVRLANTVKKILDFGDIPCVFWTDSTTAIAWISKEENWSVFVGNRVREIRKTTNINDWRHVPGKLNPADVPSRGSTIHQLINSQWFEGPPWLKREADDWPVSGDPEDVTEITRELRKTVATHLTLERKDILDQLNRMSNYHTIVKVVVLCKRVFNKTIGPIGCTEYVAAEITLLRLVQRAHFEGIQDKKLKNIRVFYDHDGLIRIKTKLFCGEDTEYATPIVLPGNDSIVRKLIWKEHLVCCHAGVHLLQTQLRQRYWILNGRRSIRSVVRECAKCRRFRANPVFVEEGPLPKDRIKVGLAFDVTGVDMAGPLYTKGKKKVWIALFTCANTRAIHLELCNGLSTEIFIAAFRRFVARRGRPTTVYSDNGLNFVGTSNLLKAVDWTKIVEHASISRITWRFNPPTGSWWGGFWERLIGIVKQLLRSVLGTSRINNEELQTLLCDVESVVNNRPLTYLEEEDGLQPLTPHMLVNSCGSSLIPDVDTVERELLIARYKNMQHCRDELRNRFQKEYLAMLIHKGNNRKSQVVDVGDVVLVGNDLQKRIQWPMGIVTEILPGRDGHVRVVKVKTEKGVLLRPVQRLYPLEISNKPFKQ